MPCNSDYMEATQAEENSREVAQHIVWLAGKLNLPVEGFISKAANEYYGDVTKLNTMTQKLCAMCQLPYAENHIYNGRDKDARKLADWWDKHQEADRKRLEKELAKANDEKARKKALQKLTAHERELLGLDDEGDLK